MLSSNINFKNFKISSSKKNLRNDLKIFFSSKNELSKSLSRKYKNCYDIKKIKKITKNSEIRLIGIGGSILGAKAIYDFLDKKIKKKFLFIDNFYKSNFNNKKKNNKYFYF